VTFKLKTSQVVERARSLTGRLWPVGRQRVNIFIWPAPQAGKMIEILPFDWLPKRARWSYLTRSGQEAFPESHKINPLLIKLVRSRWLDIGLVLFLRVMSWTLTTSQSINTQKKNLANIQPS